MLRGTPDHRLTIRAALLLGFGLTAGLWVVAGYQFTRRMAEVERGATAISQRYLNAQQLLSTVRAQVLVGSVYVRDALLDPNPTSAAGYRAQLQLTHQTVDNALQRYEPVVDSTADRATVERLRHEIDAFHVTMLEVLDSSRGGSANEARQLLQQRIVPKRELVFRISEEVQALNRDTFVQQQAGIAELYRVTQRRVWQQLGFALVASLGIALFASFYSGRLENELYYQRVKDRQNSQELQRLSAKLITAQEEERRSIARELHDEVGQALTAIKVELAVAESTIAASGTSTRVLEDARLITEGALQTVRDLSHLLHPAMLDDLGLRAAVDWYLRGFSKRHDIRAEMVHEGMNERLALETEVAAFRIVQEALTNVVKHARATSCRVRLERDASTLRVAIEDDGIGIDVSEPSASRGRRGLGLVGIRERAAQLRGAVRIERGPGGGTRIVAELPARTRAVTDTNEADASAPAVPAIGAEGSHG